MLSDQEAALLIRGLAALVWLVALGRYVRRPVWYRSLRSTLSMTCLAAVLVVIAIGPTLSAATAPEYVRMAYHAVAAAVGIVGLAFALGRDR